MKVLFISPSFYPATHYGGPIFINRDFCDALAQEEGIQLQVLTTDSDGPKKRINLTQTAENENYDIVYCRRWFSPDISPGLLLKMVRLVRRADIIHLNGVYSFTTIPSLLLCRIMRKPVVWSTFGALQRWKGSTRRNAKTSWETICNSISRSEQVLLHVTSEEERSESLEKLPSMQAIVLRNGICIPSVERATPFTQGGVLRLLFIGRLHPIKGIENLLHALSLTKTRFELSICGDGDAAYESKLRALVFSLGLKDLVRFHGRVGGQIKEEQFLTADLCVMPSFKESFGTVVMESLARGVPVLVSRGAPWQAIEEVGCGLWVSNEPEELSKAIDRAAIMPLAYMGQRGRDWMIREFAWRGVAVQMILQYRALLKSAERQTSEIHTRPKLAG